MGDSSRLGWGFADVDRSAGDHLFNLALFGRSGLPALVARKVHAADFARVDCSLRDGGPERRPTAPVPRSADPLATR